MSSYMFNSLEHFAYKDFTHYSELLSQFKMGDRIAKDEKGMALCKMLNEMEDENDAMWNISSHRTDWSILGAEVKYNGINRRHFKTQERFKYVLVFALDLVVSPPGRFVLHYNIPILN